MSIEPFKVGIREWTEYFSKRIEWRSLMIMKTYFLPNVMGWTLYVGGWRCEQIRSARCLRNATFRGNCSKWGVLGPGNCYLISSQSQNLRGAWKFKGRRSKGWKPTLVQRNFEMECLLQKEEVQWLMMWKIHSQIQVSEFGRPSWICLTTL